MKENSAVDDWQQLSALYEQAEVLPRALLDEMLGRLDKEGHRLLPLLKRMLAAKGEMAGSDFLGSIPRFNALHVQADSEPRAGGRVGAYRLMRLIGSGGMAEVWLAQRVDGGFVRQVAIKFLFNHPVPSHQESFAHRFSRERDILASLSHPNIAPLHDAGVTPEGRPWLALEYVQGDSIDSWCDQRTLSIEQRIRVFRQVLLAVEYAHSSLIIHRDLKPSNILVTEQGEARLLDFGIAKLLEPGTTGIEETLLTRQSGRPLTLRYAAPEQVRGERLTTSCDVYALGVVLYELLCSHSPYEMERSTPAQLEQAVVDFEPRAPSRRNIVGDVARQRGVSASQLSRVLRGDLDAVALKALRKHPGDRYGSIEAFRADLDRWLDDRPVLASAPGVAQRLAKFLKRHTRAAVAAGIACLFVLAASTWLLKMRAEAQLENARALSSQAFILDLFHLADPDEGKGSALTARDMLEIGRNRAMTQLADQPVLLADVLRRIGEMQTNISEYRAAAETLTAAVEAYRRTRDLKKMSLTQIALADDVYRMDDTARAASLLDEAQATLKSLGGTAENEAFGDISFQRGWIAFSQGRHADAASSMRSAAEHFATVLGEFDTRTIDALRGLARAEASSGQFTQAMRHIGEAAERNKRSANAVPLDAVGISVEQAMVEAMSGRYAVAIPRLDLAAQRCEQLRTAADEACALARVHEARLLLVAGRSQDALRLMPVLRAQMSLESSPRRSTEALTTACRILAANGLLDADDPIREQLRTVAESRSADSHADPAKDEATYALGEALLFDGRAEEAEGLATSKLRDLQTSGRWSDDASVGMFYRLRALALQQQGRHQAALADFEIATYRSSSLRGKDHPLTLLYALNGARSQIATGRPEPALALIDRARPILEASFGIDSPISSRLRTLRMNAAQPSRADTTNGTRPAAFF